VEQNIVLTSLASPSLYQGDTKQMVEDGYAVSIGIAEIADADANMAYCSGCTLTSLAVGSRRGGGITIVFTAKVPSTKLASTVSSCEAITSNPAVMTTNLQKVALGMAHSCGCPVSDIAVPVVGSVGEALANNNNNNNNDKLKKQSPSESHVGKLCAGFLIICLVACAFVAMRHLATSLEVQTVQGAKDQQDASAVTVSAAALVSVGVPMMHLKDDVEVPTMSGSKSILPTMGDGPPTYQGAIIDALEMNGRVVDPFDNPPAYESPRRLHQALQVNVINPEAPMAHAGALAAPPAE